MWRLIHVIAIGALLGSAGYVYGVKYRSTFAREQLVELSRAIDKEHDEINKLRAEFAALTRPDRVDALADKELGMTSLQLSQIVRIDELPFAGPKVDAIGQKLEALGLPGEASTPSVTLDGATPPVR